jgi:serine/threonine protein kinase
MGEVYRARDLKLNRDVAIKILLDRDRSDPAAAQRFQREAQAVAALNHPNIVTIHAIEEADGITFLVMELVEGRTLAEVVTAGGLPLTTVLAHGLQLADALSAAHAQGITHRDLKPSNVMVTPAGRLKVLDFGLAKLKEQIAPHEVTIANPTITGAGQIVGTVAYMSPEQASGTTIDHRSDLFSLGVMLYELATGQRPFKGDSGVTLLASILKDTPPPVSEVRPDLPREFTRIVRRALAKDPEQRYQTAKDLRNDLQEVKDELTSGTLSSGQVTAAPSPSRSRSWWLPVGALLLVAAGAAGYFAMREPGKPAAEMSVSRLTSTGHASLATISPEGKYVVHVVSDRQHSLWVRQTATGSNVQIIPPGDDRFIGLTFSPDGNYVYYTRFEGRSISNVYRIPILGGTPEPIVRDVDSDVTFSPDGSQIAFLRGRPREMKVQLLAMASDGSGAPRLVAETALDGMRIYASISWSPDGRTIAVPHGGLTLGGRVIPASIAMVDATSGAIHHRALGRWLNVTSASWMNDETVVVSAVEPGKLNGQLWLVTGDTVRRLTNDLNNYVGAAAARSSGAVVTVLGDLASGISVVTLPAAGAPSISRMTPSSTRFDGQFGLAWTSSGRLVYTSAQSGQVDLFIADPDGANARQLTRDATIEAWPAVSPDDRSLVYKAESAGLMHYDIASGRSTALTTDPSDESPSWTPDGKHVLFVRASQSSIRQFRINADRTGLMDVADAGYGGTFSPDGRHLAGLMLLNQQSVVALIPTDGTPPERGLNILSIPVILGWTPAGDAVTFLESRRGPQTIWNQPVDGSAPRELLGMGTDRIFNFAWSKDGRLAVSHGPVPTDVVLLTNVR